MRPEHRPVTGYFAAGDTNVGFRPRNGDPPFDPDCWLRAPKRRGAGSGGRGRDRSVLSAGDGPLRSIPAPASREEYSGEGAEEFHRLAAKASPASRAVLVLITSTACRSRRSRTCSASRWAP